MGQGGLWAGRPDPAAELMEALSADIRRTLDAVWIPAFVVDAHRRVRWQNRAALELMGDLRRKLDRSFIAPEDLVRARDAFARKRMGARQTDYEATAIRADGKRVRLRVNSVALRGACGEMIGAFALAVPVTHPEEPPAETSPPLTPRQLQTLKLLAAGYSTSDMAQLMGLSEATVRNHVKTMLMRLGARSRVEAVAKARRSNLI